MTRNKNIYIYFFTGLLLLSGYFCAVAQEVKFTATVDAEKIGVEDQVQLRYTVQDAVDLQTIAPGNFNDFQLLAGPFQSIQSSNIYGRSSSSISLTYVLRPKHAGTLTISPAVAKDKAGHTYQSNSVTIEVVNGSLMASAQPRQRQANPSDPFGDDPFASYYQRQRQAMQQRQQQMQQQRQSAAQPQEPANLKNDLFIRVTADKTKVHVGEQITVSYKLYTRVPMNASISKLPSLNGFWTQDFELPTANPKPTEEVINGKKYQVFLLKKSAIFAQQTGTLELDPAEAKGVARIVTQVRQRSPFANMFDDPFFQNAFGSLMMNDPFFNDDIFSTMAYKDVPVHLKSSPVKIQVTQLPITDQPTGFGGAVGKFTVKAEVNKTDLSTDDALNLTFTISGSGNLKLIEAPKLNLPNGLDAFDPAIVDTITGRSTTITGSKIITYAIAPQIPGDYTIPAIPFSYFDPHTKTYQSLQTEPIKIHISRGKNYNANKQAAIALTDIHNIEAKQPGDFHVNSKPMIFTIGYWSIYALPLLAFVGIAMYRRRENELNTNTPGLRSKRANKIALKRLNTAKTLLQENKQDQFYEEVSKAIWLYLSDKLNIPLSSLSREQAQVAMETRRIPLLLQDKVTYLINECETALYAPTGGSQQMNKTYNDAVNILSKLEESINA